MKNAKEERSINIFVKRHVTWPVARVTWLTLLPLPAALKSAIFSLLVLKWFVLVSRRILSRSERNSGHAKEFSAFRPRENGARAKRWKEGGGGGGREGKKGTTFHLFALALFSRGPNAKNSFAWPEFLSLRTGTLATRATIKIAGSLVFSRNSAEVTKLYRRPYLAFFSVRPRPYRDLAFAGEDLS